MVTLLMAVLLSATPQLACESITVCHASSCICSKPVKKKVVRKPAFVMKPITVTVEKPAPAPVINVNVYQKQSQTQLEWQDMDMSDVWFPKETKRPGIILGLRGAVGVAWCLPQGLGLLGLRARVPSISLGAELYTEFYWGHGAQLMLYPVQTRRIDWHINTGVYWFQHRPYVLTDFPRKLDWTIGTGVEVKLVGPLYLTGDLRTRIPNPIAAMEATDKLNTDANNVLGRSFLQTQFLLGLMLRN